MMLCLCLCLLTLPAASLAEGDNYTVRYQVTFNQTEARKMLSMINDFRTGSEAWYWDRNNTDKTWCSDLQPMVYDIRLEQAAMQRAAELAIYYAHTRPDGGSCFDVFDEIDIPYWSLGENIAIGMNTYTSASQVFAGWQETNDPYEGQGHRRNMLNSAFNRVGFGYARIGNYHFWTQEFARAYDDVPTLDQPTNAAIVVNTRVNENLITRLSVLSAPTGQITVDYGNPTTLPEVTATLTMTNTWPTNRSVSVSLVPKWDSSDPLCAAVNGENVTGVALGNTTLNATLKDQTFSLPITVRYADRLTPDLTLPTGLATLGDEALSGVAAAAVSLPASLRALGSHVFDGSAVRQVTFNGDGFTIAPDAFQGCTVPLVVFCPDGSTADALAGVSGITLVRVR